MTQIFELFELAEWILQWKNGNQWEMNMPYVGANGNKWETNMHCVGVNGNKWEMNMRCVGVKKHTLNPHLLSGVKGKAIQILTFTCQSINQLGVI